MRLVVVALIGALADAYHPFVGQHADANTVFHENGTISQRVEAKYVSNTKHAQLHSKDLNNMEAESDQSLFSSLSSTLFGSVAAEKKKLRQDSGNIATILKNRQKFVWTGEIYMGKFSKMDVIYDTGSDWLSIEGADCETCDGNKYDIGIGLDTGAANLVSEE